MSVLCNLNMFVNSIALYQILLLAGTKCIANELKPSINKAVKISRSTFREFNIHILKKNYKQSMLQFFNMHSLISLSENYSIINERPSLVLCIKCLLFKLISYNIKILMYKIRSYLFCFFFIQSQKIN